MIMFGPGGLKYFSGKSDTAAVARADRTDEPEPRRALQLWRTRPPSDRVRRNILSTMRIGRSIRRPCATARQVGFFDFVILNGSFHSLRAEVRVLTHRPAAGRQGPNRHLDP